MLYISLVYADNDRLLGNNIHAINKNIQVSSYVMRLLEKNNYIS